MKHYLRFMITLLLATVWSLGGYAQETVYSTGFESSDGFKADTNYKGDKNIGNNEKQWHVYYGCVSTNSKIEGVQSLQMRYYSGDKKTPYAEMSFSVNKVTDVSFSAKAGANGKIKVQYSTDEGKNWSDGQQFDVSSNVSEIKYTISENALSNVRIKITSLLTVSKSNVSLCIDEFKLINKDTRKKTTTTFGSDIDNQTITINEGEESSFPTHVATCTTEGVTGTFAYASDNACVTVDQNGKTAPGVGFGKAKITATFTPDETYKDTYSESSAFYYIDYKEKEKTATTLSFEKSFVALTTLDYSSFTGQTATLTAGDETLTGKDITYSKTGDDIFSSFNEETGELALNGNVGTAIVKASFAGDDTYASSTVLYTIKVNQIYSDLASFKKAIPSSASTSAPISFSLKLTDAIVTYVSGTDAYVQDATSGVLLYDSSKKDGGNAFDLTAGQKFTGTIDVTACLYNGMAEVTAWTPVTVTKEDNVEIPVKIVTLAELNGSDYSKYECVRVKVENATVTTAYNTAKKATITQGDQTYLIHGEVSGLNVNLDDVCDFVGYPIYWKTSSLNEHQLSVWSQDDITVKSSVVATTLSFDPSKTEYTVEKGKETSFTAPKAIVTDANNETVADAKITYKSSKPEVAAVAEDGTVSFVGFGTTTITASYAGDATHKAAKDISYTIIYGKVKTTMVWSETEVKANIGQDFVAPTLSLTADGESILEGKTITYESEDENVAMVDDDGTVVLMDKEGTTKITAKFAGDDTYAENSASYTLTVVDPNKKELTFDFTSSHYGYGTTSSADGKGDVPVDGTINSGDVTITHVKQGKPNTTFYASDLRAYAGAQLSISVPVGYNITKVVYTDKKNCANFTIDSKKLEESTWTGKANSLLMTFSGTGQFSSITVSYSSLPSVTFDENSETNANVALENAGETVNVTLNRTIGTDYLNPVCLPFAMDETQIAEAFGEGSKVSKLNENITDETLQFNYVNTMAAGEPYIVEATKASSTISLKGVTINENEGKSSEAIGNDIYVSFCGNIDPYAFTAADGTQLFLGKDNTLYEPQSVGQKLKGLRGYFTVEGNNSKALKIVVNGGTTTIESLMNGTTMTGKVYNLNGQYVGISLDGLAKGVYLMNGKKYVVK